MDVRDRVPPPPPPPPRPSGGLSLHTLLLAAAGAGAAALLTSAFWPEGSILSAALTPVIVALVSEALRRPTQRVGQVAATSIPRRRARRRHAGTPEPPTEATPPERPYAVYGQARRRPNIRPAVVLATAALAFVIAVVAITVPEAIFGGAVANDRQRTFLPSRSNAEEERPEEDAAPDAGSTDAAPDETQTEEAPATTTTTPEGEGTEEEPPADPGAEDPGASPPTPTPTPTTPAEPPSAPESGAQPPE
jgi:hypothetical protein